MSAATPPPSASTPQNTTAITLQIVSIVLYTFIAFLCVGLPIAVMPGYVHDHLGYSAVIAGATIGVQYLATLISRPLAGRCADNVGTRRTVQLGLAGILVGGVLTLVATLLEAFSMASLVVLVVSRVLLGLSQGMIGVGTITWCIRQVGPEQTARSISWNGIASYGAIAIGAPVGVMMVSALGFHSLGLALILLAGLALSIIRRREDPPLIKGERLPFWSVFGRVAPYGLSLTLSSIGYGTLTTFITLYYVFRGWDGAAWCLTVFGVCFIVSRLVFINAINRFGGFASAIACLVVETMGLTLLWLAPNTAFTLAGAALVGFGLSLVYPAIGVEAIKQVPSSSRGAGLSAYAVFFDLALALSGPLMGAVALHMGYEWIFLMAALLSLLALGLTMALRRRDGA